jgi:hypothetical protein
MDARHPFHQLSVTNTASPLALQTKWPISCRMIWRRLGVALGQLSVLSFPSGLPPLFGNFYAEIHGVGDQLCVPGSFHGHSPRMSLGSRWCQSLGLSQRPRSPWQRYWCLLVRRLSDLHRHLAVRLYFGFRHFDSHFRHLGFRHFDFHLQPHHPFLCRL